MEKWIPRPATRADKQALAVIEGHVEGVSKSTAPQRTYAGDGPLAWNSMRGFLSDMTGAAGAFRSLGWSDAIQQAAVIACLDIMAQDIAKAPLVLYKRTPDGGSKAIGPRDHPLAELFWLEPNDFMTWNEWTQMVIYHLGLSSNSYIIPRKTLRGVTESLLPVLPGRVEVDVAQSSKELVYRVTPGTAFEELQLDSPNSFILFRDEIIHVKQRFLNGFSGLSTLAVGNRVFSLTENLQQFSNRLFARDGTLRGVFETSEQFEQEQYDRLRDSLNLALQQLRDVGFPLVLENGLKFNKISMTPDEMLQKDAWDAQIVDTARLFRIPLHKVQHLTAIKYDNIGPMEAAYVADSLLPRCQAIEERLNLALLSRDERLDHYIQFDRKVLNRADEKALNERVTKQFQSGIITQNEAREELGYNPAKKGKVYQLPANAVLIDEEHNIIVHPGKAKPAGEEGQEGETNDDAKDDNGDDAE